MAKRHHRSPVRPDSGPRIPVAVAGSSWTYTPQNAPLRIAHREAINAVLYAYDRRPVPRSWPRCDPALWVTPTLRPVTLRACPRTSGLHESRQGYANKVFGRGGLTSTPFPNRVSCVKARRNHGLAKALQKRSVPQCVGRNRLRCGIRQAHHLAEPLPVNPAWGRGRHNVPLRLECGVRPKRPHLDAVPMSRFRRQSPPDPRHRNCSADALRFTECWPADVTATRRRSRCPTANTLFRYAGTEKRANYSTTNPWGRANPAPSPGPAAEPCGSALECRQA